MLKSVLEDRDGQDYSVAEILARAVRPSLE
jgi:hypothetical protein